MGAWERGGLGALEGGNKGVCERVSVVVWKCGCVGESECGLTGVRTHLR